MGARPRERRAMRIVGRRVSFAVPLGLALVFLPGAASLAEDPTIEATGGAYGVLLEPVQRAGRPRRDGDLQKPQRLRAPRRDLERRPGNAGLLQRPDQRRQNELDRNLQLRAGRHLQLLLHGPPDRNERHDHRELGRPDRPNPGPQPPPPTGAGRIAAPGTRCPGPEAGEIAAGERRARVRGPLSSRGRRQARGRAADGASSAADAGRVGRSGSGGWSAAGCRRAGPRSPYR